MDNSTHELSPATYTVQDVFGFPSQMPLQGFAPGHPLVPKATAGYVWDAKLAKDFIEWLTEPNPDPLWISGPTGCGKTETLKNVFAALNIPTVIVSAKASTEPDDILGRVQLRNGDTGQIHVPSPNPVGDRNPRLGGGIPSVGAANIRPGIDQILLVGMVNNPRHKSAAADHHVVPGIGRRDGRLVIRRLSPRHDRQSGCLKAHRGCGNP